MNIEKVLFVAQWLQLPNEERLLMRELFGIPRTSGSIMIDGKLQSDGCTQSDLRAVSVSAMQNFLDSDVEDFDVLLQATFSKVSVMVKEKQQELLNEIKHLQAKDRRENLLVVVSSLVDSIKKLPVDMQFEVKQEIDLLLNAAVKTTVESEVKETKTNAKGTKKAK